jgi:hypothetical protein
LIHNKNLAAYHARLQQQQQNRMKTMSMSTGSDRETSSVGSLSPTITHAQNQNGMCFGNDQQASPTSIFTYSFSPSNSPILREMATISPPPLPPTSSSAAAAAASMMFVKPKFVETAHVNVMKQIPEDTRLPVFNQISSAIDAIGTLTI